MQLMTIILDLSILAIAGPFLEQPNLFLRVAFHGDSCVFGKS